MALWFWIVVFYGASLPVLILLWMRFCSRDKK